MQGLEWAWPIGGGTPLPPWSWLGRAASLPAQCWGLATHYSYRATLSGGPRAPFPVETNPDHTNDRLVMPRMPPGGACLPPCAALRVRGRPQAVALCILGKGQLGRPKDSGGAPCVAGVEKGHARSSSGEAAQACAGTQQQVMAKAAAPVAEGHAFQPQRPTRRRQHSRRARRRNKAQPPPHGSLSIVQGVLAGARGQEEEIRRRPSPEGRHELSLFAQDMILCVENPANPTQSPGKQLGAFSNGQVGQHAKASFIAPHEREAWGGQSHSDGSGQNELSGNRFSPRSVRRVHREPADVLNADLGADRAEREPRHGWETRCGRQTTCSSLQPYPRPRWPSPGSSEIQGPQNGQSPLERES